MTGVESGTGTGNGPGTQDRVPGWSEAVAAAEGTLMDPGAFVRLREWGGDVLLGKMVALFHENGPLRMAEIEEALAQGDAPRVERGAHTLKSSAGNLGAERLRRLCQLMEDAGEEGRLDAARAFAPLLREAYGQTIRALELSRTPVPDEATGGEVP